MEKKRDDTILLLGLAALLLFGKDIIPKLATGFGAGLALAGGGIGIGGGLAASRLVPPPARRPPPDAATQSVLALQGAKQPVTLPPPERQAAATSTAAISVLPDAATQSALALEGAQQPLVGIGLGGLPAGSGVPADTAGPFSPDVQVSLDLSIQRFVQSGGMLGLPPDAAAAFQQVFAVNPLAGAVPVPRPIPPIVLTQEQQQSWFSRFVGALTATPLSLIGVDVSTGVKVATSAAIAAAAIVATGGAAAPLAPILIP